MSSWIVFLATLVAVAQATKWSDCGSKAGEVISLDVTGCPDGQDVCVLKRGTKAGVTLKFTSKEDSNTVKAIVHGIIHSVPLPFPLPQKDACKESGMTCPIKKGNNYTYTNAFDVRNSYPKLDVKVRWELQGQDGQDVVCLEIPCTIQ